MEKVDVYVKCTLSVCHVGCMYEGLRTIKVSQKCGVYPNMIRYFPCPETMFSNSKGVE